MNERTMVYLDDVIEVIYQALRTPVPDYHKDPFHDSMGVAMAMGNEIPPAQPETFEWCHDCKEYDQEQHCCHRWSQQIRKTIEELEASYPQEAKDELLYWKERAAKMERDYYIRITECKRERNGEWISFDERLPEIGRNVLVNVCAKDAPYKVVLMSASSAKDHYKNANINAWMPLPEPYKGEEV